MALLDRIAYGLTSGALSRWCFLPLLVLTPTITSGSAQSAELIAWSPQAAGLNGASFTADTIRFADYDLIIQAPDAASFTEAGYLPIQSFALGGQPVASLGLNDPSGAGWGAYMRITGSGIPFTTPEGGMGAVYTQLSYQVLGFNGLATYGFDVDDNVVGGGALDSVTTLFTGSLINGSIAFVPTASGLNIEGQVSSTVSQAVPGFVSGRLDTLDLTILHPPADYTFVSQTVTKVAASAGTNGTFAAGAAVVPEPSSIILIVSALLAAITLRVTNRKYGPDLALGADMLENHQLPRALPG